jgi:hypothetical protein
MGACGRNEEALKKSWSGDFSQDLLYEFLNPCPSFSRLEIKRRSLIGVRGR